MQTNINRLKRGCQFKLNKRQRKWRILRKLILLPNSDTLPKYCRGQILVIFDNCRQSVIAPGTLVIIDPSESRSKLHPTNDCISFDEWFDLFLDKTRSLGYNSPLDKYSFEAEWKVGIMSESSAENFVEKMNRFN